MFDQQKSEVIAAIDIVKKSSVIAKKIQQELAANSLSKDDRSPVTAADFAVQAIAGKLLAEDFPNDPLVGEEDASVLRQPDQKPLLQIITKYLREEFTDATDERVCAWIDHGIADTASRYWTIDPIDGTKGFLRGDQFAIALALVADGIVKLGILGCPNLVEGKRTNLDGEGTLSLALRGEGAWQTNLFGAESEWEQIFVSQQEDAAFGRVLRSFEKAHTNVSSIDLFANKLQITADPVCMDSQAKYAVLASGNAEYYLRMLSPSRADYRENIWDQAAGSILVEEAGGKVTDLHGQPLDFGQGRKLLNTRGVCATNGYLHDKALSALRFINA